MFLVQKKDDHRGTVGCMTSLSVWMAKRRRSYDPEPPLDMRLEVTRSYSTEETVKYLLLLDITVRVKLS